MTTSAVDVRVEQQVAWIRLNRPAQMNAITLEMGEELVRVAAEILTRIQADDVRVVVVHGAGDRAFCAGADLKQRRSMSERELWRHGVVIRDFALWCHDCPVPVIAAIQGHCLGGGLEIAVACDLRISTVDASLGFTEATIGAFPGAGGAVFTPRLIGAGAAKDLLFSGRRISGAEAHELGLVQRSIMEHQQLLGVASEMAATIAANGPLAVQALKTLLNHGPDVALDDALTLSDALRRPLNATDDYAEGLAAFAERRTPTFRGH